MTKTQRILTMMRFINNRQFFTIHTICEAFSISRSTAIRDLTEIQSLGLPLVSSVGPDGGYAVMHNQLLQKSRLTDDELRALIISFLQTADDQLPYLQNPRELLEKLFSEAGPTKQEGLLQLQEVLLLDRSDLTNMRQLPTTKSVPEMLTFLFNVCLIDRQVSLQYEDKIGLHRLPACYIHYIFHEHGTWYVDLLNTKKQSNQVLPVKKLRTVAPLTESQQLSKKALEQLIADTTREANVQLKLTGDAISNFQKNHFFHDTLTFNNDDSHSANVSSYLDLNYPKRVQAYASWILALGSGVTIKAIPEKLKSCLAQTANQQQRLYGH